MKQFSIWATRLSIALLVALMLSSTISCKKDDDDDPQPSNNNNPSDTSQTWRTVRITGIEVLEFPENKPGGSNWDSPITGIPEPDIFSEIYVDGSKVWGGESNRKENVEQSDLPESWSVTGFSAVDLSARIQIKLLDYDSLQSNEEMTSFTFSGTNYKPTGSGSTNTYTYNSGGYRIRISMSFSK